MKSCGMLATVCALLPPLGGLAQQEQNLSAINPALFSYGLDDVLVVPPTKHNGGKNIIAPDPDKYPWEMNLGNGMPNVMVAPDGSLSLYVSCFLFPSPVPYSKVGVMVYTNNTSDPVAWSHPDAGLYWYDPQAKDVERKLLPSYRQGLVPTNVVAVDIESLGIYEDLDFGVSLPIKLVYLPQREKQNTLVAGYEMKREFDANGILTGFSKMKQDRMSAQLEYNFKFINADTHMAYLKHDGDFYLFSRLNAKRSSLKPGEVLPFPSGDPRVRYRRETVTRLGATLASGNFDVDVALDRSTRQWEPYSLQPFQMDGFETDVWWGIATMFGSTAETDVDSRQRAELAFSNNGVDWFYVKPGTPFLDNGVDPQGGDHGCINMGKPIPAGRFSSSPNELLYYYVASNQRHVGGRVAGVSLASGKCGKWAGLKAGAGETVFMSPIPASGGTGNMLKVSLYEALRHGAEFAPKILADVTQDPRGRSVADLSSYVVASVFAYDAARPGGKGALLAASMGSSRKGTEVVSDDYESVGNFDGRDHHSKALLFGYMKSVAEARRKVISLKDDLSAVPVVFEARGRNSTFHGLQFKRASGADYILDTRGANGYKPPTRWRFEPNPKEMPCHTEVFSSRRVAQNSYEPTNLKMGVAKVVCTPKTYKAALQTVLRLYGDAENDIALCYTSDGEFLLKMMVHGVEFASMSVAPPQGKVFAGRQVEVSLEVLKNGQDEDAEAVAALRVRCPELKFEEVKPQPILWNWKHDVPTDADKANARAFAFLQFASFVAGMDKITVGTFDDKCDQRFMGSIDSVEVSDGL